MYFYPRPPRGGRPVLDRDLLRHNDFYPRPPRGGRLANLGEQAILKKISIHALREEGDLFCKDGEVSAEWISIHALREEGDARFPPFANVTENISIHALREEGDEPETGTWRQVVYFYPRPPRGGRPQQ